jgi:two-component system, chemotaxis family, chemotaxis protein CheY
MQMPKTILIVDDSDMIRKVLNFKLKGAGYTILVADNGDDALVNFDGREVDLVITDLNMPGKDGIQLIQEIRTRSYYRFLPVILFASESSVNAPDLIRRSGATILFDKNSIKEKLLPTVSKLLS